MEPIFRTQYTIEDIHLDCYGRMKSSVILYFAQEVAGKHCVELSLDWKTLAQKRLFWAVIRHRVHITRLPVAGETITVETWPMPTTRVAYPRSMVAYDEAGCELFRSVSLWVLMDTDTRAMILPGKSGIAVAGTTRGTELAAPGSLVPKQLGNTVTRQVTYTELDRNGHMNNTRYLDWIDDLLPSVFHAGHTPREITVCYLSEAREGQQMELSWELSDGPELRVEARRRDVLGSGNRERVFAAQVRF